MFSHPYPLEGKVLRQHVPPLLWIVGLHGEDQQWVRMPVVRRVFEPPTSLNRLGITRMILTEMHERFGNRETSEDYSKDEEDKQKYLEWIEERDAACRWAREALESGNRDRIRTLPSRDEKGWKPMVKLAADAHKLDHSHRIIQTWAPERQGGNMKRP